MEKSLKALEALMEKWEFTGNVHEDDGKKIEGWESYESNNDGQSITDELSGD